MTETKEQFLQEAVKAFEEAINDIDKNKHAVFLVFDDKTKKMRLDFLNGIEEPNCAICNNRAEIGYAHKNEYNKMPPTIHFSMKQFTTTRNFKNVIGPESRMIEKRVNFFLKNKKWIII
jgi:hypothetical protein